VRCQPLHLNMPADQNTAHGKTGARAASCSIPVHKLKHPSKRCHPLHLHMPAGRSTSDRRQVPLLHLAAYQAQGKTRI
jgi:hypothetical protein